MGNPKYRNKFQQRNNTPNYEGRPHQTANSNNQMRAPANSPDKQVARGKYAQMLAALKSKITPTGSSPKEQEEALKNVTNKAHNTPEQQPEYTTVLPNVERTGLRTFSFNRADTVQYSYNQTAPTVSRAGSRDFITPNGFTTSSPGMFKAVNEQGRVVLTIDPSFEGQLTFTINNQSETINLSSESVQLEEIINPEQQLLLSQWQQSLEQLETIKNNQLVADRPTFGGNPTWQAFNGEVAQLEQECIELLQGSDWKQDRAVQQQVQQKLAAIGTVLVQYANARETFKPAKESFAEPELAEILPFKGVQRLNERVFTLDNTKRAWVYAEGFNNNKPINIANIASLQGVFTATEYANGYRVTVDPLFEGLIQLQQWETDEASNWQPYTVESLPNRFDSVAATYEESLANNEIYKRFMTVGQQYMRLLKSPKADPQLRRVIGAEYEQFLQNFSIGLDVESKKKPVKKNFLSALLPTNLEDSSLYAMGKDVVLNQNFTPKMSRLEIRTNLLTLSSTQEFSLLDDDQMLALFELRCTLPKISGEQLDDEASVTFNRRDIQAVALAIQKDMFANNRDQVFTEAMQAMGLNPEADRGTETSFGIRLVLGLPLNPAEQKLYNELHSAPSLLADADNQIYNGEQQLASGRYQLAVSGNELNKGYQTQRRFGWIPVVGGIIRSKVRAGQSEYNVGYAKLQAGEYKLQDGKIQRAEGERRFLNTLQRLGQASDDVQQGVLEEAMLQLITGMDGKHISPMSGSADLTPRTATMQDLLRIETAGKALSTIGRSNLDVIEAKSGASIVAYPPNGLTLNTIDWMINAQSSLSPLSGKPQSGGFWIETNKVEPTETAPILDDIYRLAQTVKNPKLTDKNQSQPKTIAEKPVEEANPDVVVIQKQAATTIDEQTEAEPSTRMVRGSKLEADVLPDEEENNNVVLEKDVLTDIYPEGVSVAGKRMRLSSKAFSIHINGQQFNYRADKEFAADTDLFTVVREGDTYTFTVKTGVNGLQLFRNEQEKAWVPVPFSTLG